ncbi:hypothetical protein HELRODRAFT_82003, partial [Helobdella robusta]|uniref:Uncharacterized protein n=1 Tax=Helobdella robusta TaxID=6412 RepID=T1G4L6_HELRO
MPQQQPQPQTSPPQPPAAASSSTIIDLNVGGVHYSTALATLVKHPNSKLAKSVLKLFNIEPTEQQLDNIVDTSNNNSTIPSSSSTSSTNITTLATVSEATKKIFIDRDGVLFRFILDFLRQKSTDHFKLPEHFAETERLACEADYYGLTEMVHQLRNKHKSSLATKFLEAGDENERCITLGYRGTFAFGRDGGMADVKFRKLLRILVAGRVQLCKE